MPSDQSNGQISVELFDILGEDAFLRFVEEYGGRKIFVPGTDRAKSVGEMAGIVGPELASRLCAAFGGCKINVPIAKVFRVRKYHQAGVSNVDIAKRLCMTVSAVERSLATGHLFRGAEPISLVGLYPVKRANERRLARVAAKAGRK